MTGVERDSVGLVEPCVLAVEDDPAVGRTLTRLLRRPRVWSVIVARSVAEARWELENPSGRWLGFVVDVGLPEGPTAGLDLVASLRRLTIVNAAASLGATFICKPPAEAELAPFVARIAAMASPSYDTHLIALSAATRFGLTERETQVLASALRDESSHAFCERENLSERTFRAHSASIVFKSGAMSLRELVLSLLREALASARLA